MTLTSAVLIVVALHMLGAAHAQNQYVAGFLPNAPPGYVLASLADLNSSDFLNQYNTVGINFVQPFPGGYLCCVYSVVEGYVSIGPTDDYSNFIQPFAGGSDICTSFTQPNGTTFGVGTINSPGPFSGMWISTLSLKEQEGFRVTGAVPSVSSCATVSATQTAIFKAVPQFVIRPQGANFPAPPASEYEVAYLADVQSAEFQEYYNTTGGIILTGINSPSQYCCLIHVADGGWLYYGYAPSYYSPLSLFVQGTSTWSCNQVYNNQVHSMGTAFGGPLTGLMFYELNVTTTKKLGYFVNNTQHWDGCNVPNTLTVYKRVV